MNTILILSPDQSDFNMFNAHYAYMPIHFSWAQNPDEAIKNIDLEKPTHIFLITREIEQMAEWIGMLHSNEVKEPFICFTRSLDWADRDMLWKSGALDIFEFPMNRKELGYILQTFTLGRKESSQPISDHIRGSLKDFNVLDLINTFEKSENGGFLFLENGVMQGKISFVKGRVYDAQYADHDPLEAVTIMSSWDNGVFFARFDKEKRQRKIMLENEQIILECKNYRQSQQEMLAKLPPEDRKLFTDPGLEYEEFGPKDRLWFQKFRTGYTLKELREEYKGNLNFLLKKLLFWLERNWLMEEEKFKNEQERLIAAQKRSVFRKLVSRVFPGKAAKPAAIETQKEQEKEQEESFFEEIIKKPYLFKNKQLIQSFKESMEEAS